MGKSRREARAGISGHVLISGDVLGGKRKPSPLDLGQRCGAQGCRPIGQRALRVMMNPEKARRAKALVHMYEHGIGPGRDFVQKGLKLGFGARTRCHQLVAGRGLGHIYFHKRSACGQGWLPHRKFT